MLLIMKRLSQKINEEILIFSLKQGNRQAFTTLYDNYSGAIFGVLKRIVKDDELAKDLLQDTFIKVYQQIALYDAQRGRLFTWLLNIARHAAFDELRKRKSAILLHFDETAVSEIDSHYQTAQLKADFFDVPDLVKKLTSGKYTLIDMVYFKGYTLTEVATELDIPLGTVKTRVRSAIQTLRTYYTSYQVLNG